ncbi:FecR family protein, partial [Sulfurimonas sp.]|nr:FecR family protein [Sulfurimonas sp.]
AIANNVVGTVSAKSADISMEVLDGNSLDEKMVLYTKSDSTVTVIFKDNSKLVLGSNAILNLKKYAFKPTKDEYAFELFLEAGSLSFESGKIGELSPEDFVLKTPDGTVAIRGTKFFIKVQ